MIWPLKGKSELKTDEAKPSKNFDDYYTYTWLKIIAESNELFREIRA